MPDKVVVEASGSIIKNVKSVIVPNTGHLKGINAAAAAGIVAGDPDKQLEVIATVSQEQIRQMKQFMEEVPIQVVHMEDGCTFDIIVTVFSGKSYAKVRIANFHTNIVLIEKNGEVLKSEAVSDDSGRAAFAADLPMGVYMVKETRAPEGYYLSNAEVIFDFEQYKDALCLTWSISGILQ